MLYNVTHCTGHVSTNTRPHQLYWREWEMGTAIYAQVEPGGWSTPQMHVYCVSMVWGQVLA